MMTLPQHLNKKSLSAISTTRRLKGDWHFYTVPCYCHVSVTYYRLLLLPLGRLSCSSRPSPEQLLHFVAIFAIFLLLRVRYSVASRCERGIMPKAHCAKSTAECGWIDHCCSIGGSFLVILAMTMTMTINSNSVLLIRVTSSGQHKSFEHVPMRILFIPGYVHWKRVVFFFVTQPTCCILDCS